MIPYCPKCNAIMKLLKQGSIETLYCCVNSNCDVTMVSTNTKGSLIDYMRLQDLRKVVLKVNS